jgi:hypothetical protein
LLRRTLEDVNRNSSALREAIKAADAATASARANYDASNALPLKMELTDKSEPFELKGVEFEREMSEVSGAVRVIFKNKPLNLTVPFYTQARTSASVATPLYYVVPPQWTEVIERLALHGVGFTRLNTPLEVESETYRFSEVKWAGASFEGRVPVTYKTEVVKTKRTYPQNSVLIKLNQPAARVAIHLLEPAAPDSLVAWGFFNPIFEQKEYGEDYKIEMLAREMLASDEKLRAEFEARIKNDPRFAASPRQRLQFFFERSPYADAEQNLYPVGRITSPLTNHRSGQSNRAR